MSVYRSSRKNLELEAALTALLHSGFTPREAIGHLWTTVGYGLLELSHAVQVVCVIEGREARRLVIKATFERQRSSP